MRPVKTMSMRIFSCKFIEVNHHIKLFIFGCVIHSALHTLAGPAPYEHEMNLSKICISDHYLHWAQSWWTLQWIDCMSHSRTFFRISISFFYLSSGTFYNLGISVSVSSHTSIPFPFLSKHPSSLRQL